MRKMSWLKVAGTAAVVALFISFPSLADDNTRFVDGTDVNGIAIGGLTQEEAGAKISQSYAQSYKLTILERNGKKEEITGEQIGLTVTVPGNLKELLDSQNLTGRQSGPSAGNSYTLELTASFDEALLKARIQSLACLSGADITETKDAHISEWKEGEPFTIVPEVQGNSLNASLTEAAIQTAVASGASSVDLEACGCYVPVQVTKDDEALNLLCERMNQCRDMVITYRFGEQTEELKGEVFTQWFTGGQDGQVQIDRAKAAAYIGTLASKYDTAGTARTFHTTAGQDVVLTGPYGWKLDQTVETDTLLLLIQTGQSQVREPVYAASAASRTAPDWGNTYVEVDMGNQHVYLYENGAVVWDAPCVTGNVSKNYTTPEGIYSLAYKETDRVLRGAKKADGTYEYESPVSYWMPFNGGIGLHDANWRDKFGGTIYQYAGSHGCINLPPATVKALYDRIDKGTPVICHN